MLWVLPAQSWPLTHRTEHPPGQTAPLPTHMPWQPRRKTTGDQPATPFLETPASKSQREVSPGKVKRPLGQTVPKMPRTPQCAQDHTTLPGSLPCSCPQDPGSDPKNPQPA